jgi:hypothetical protein
MNRSALWKSLIVFFVMFCATNALAQDRSKLLDEMKSLRSQLQAKEQEFLSPSAEDRVAFAEFLKQPDTGLIRLLPREKYGESLLIRGAGAYYSFTRLTHEYGYGSDLSLEQNNFQVGFAGADFGYLSKLGEINLDQVTLDHPGVKFLADFVTTSKEPEARVEQRLSGEGVSAGGYIYKRSFPAEASATYILRSINYGDSDVLVAFRAVRIDEDGSFLILWKLLKKFPIPKLERP